VILDPDLAFADVDVNDRAVDAAYAVPAHVHDLVVVAVGVYDGFRLDLAVRRLVAGVLVDEVANNSSVTI
jgi:hypothetical protein